MAAGLGFKTFTTGEVLTAADTNGYLMQGILVFASAAARDSAITSPQEGQFAYLKDTNVTTYYTGSAWANVDTTGMTNPMTTTGDMIYSSSGSTPARLGIGSTGNVLTVAGGVPSWAAPAGGGGMTLLSTTSISGTTTTISSISQSYKHLLLIINKVTCGTAVSLRVLGNGSTTNTLCGGYAFTGGGFNYDSGVINGTNGFNTATMSLTIHNYASTTAPKIGGFNFNSDVDARTMGTWFYSQDTEITSIGISQNAGVSLTGGTALLYGVS